MKKTQWGQMKEMKEHRKQGCGNSWTVGLFSSLLVFVLWVCFSMLYFSIIYYAFICWSWKIRISFKPTCWSWKIQISLKLYLASMPIHLLIIDDPNFSQAHYLASMPVLFPFFTKKMDTIEIVPSLLFITNVMSQSKCN